MARPSAPGLRVRKWDAGSWSEAQDAVVTEEPLQLMLDGEPLSVVMRTPGQDIELALGLFYAEGIARSLGDIRSMRISAESGESEPKVDVDASIVESNHVDVRMAAKPRRKPERSMLASSACGVCGAVLIEDLRRDLSVLGRGDQPLGEQEAGGQIEVVAWSAHGHRHRCAADADLQRLLGGELVAMGAGPLGAHHPDLRVALAVGTNRHPVPRSRL